MRKVGK